MTAQVIVFRRDVRILSGAFSEIWNALLVEYAYDASDLLVFNARSGEVIDVDPRSPPEPVSVQNAETDKPRRGRPKLGVVSKEVTLLPRHWEWLAQQQGGASAALRRLIDEARKSETDEPSRKSRQAATYNFIKVMAGDRKGFEEALRCLYRNDEAGFRQETNSWPNDIRTTATEFAFG